MDATFSKRSRIKPAIWLAVAAALFVFSATLLATPAHAASFFYTFLTTIWPAGLLLLTAYGLGRLARPFLVASENARPLQLALGLAILLTLIQLIGLAGLLIAPVAITLCAGGAALAIDQLVRTSKQQTSRDGSAQSSLHTPWLLLVILPLAVLAVASASPPGWVWDSEFGAYDALSYHFQLPQEWYRAGRIAPVKHNVYSYLPGSLENAYTFIAALTNAPIDSPAGHGLAAGTGWRLLSCQFFHAALGLASAWLLGAFVRSRLARITANARTQRAGAWIAASFMLATPWVIVVGSLGYNELGVIALGAGAMLAAGDRKLGAMTRGALAGLLVGAACGCKPTALILVTPVVGLILIDQLPARAWMRPLLRTALPACAAGTIMLSPWLSRNAAHGGNPVFPQMTGVFGQAHWSEKQVDRYQSAHSFDGSVADRLRLLVWADPAASEDSPVVARFRGVSNWQWGVLFPASIGLGLVLLGARTTRRDASILIGGLGYQVLAWLFLTHLQSRFLLPCVLPAAALLGIYAGSCDCRRVRIVMVGLVIVQTALSGWIYTAQHGANPSDGLSIEPGMYAGRPYSNELGATIEQAWVNQRLDANAVVYLLGDATPLYFDSALVYNTTWDAWAIGDAIRAAPDDPGAWADALRARGITHVLVSRSEIARLHGSGWSDPGVTPERIDRWMSTLGEPVMAWPRSGRWLYRLAVKEEARP